MYASGCLIIFGTGCSSTQSVSTAPDSGGGGGNDNHDGGVSPQVPTIAASSIAFIDSDYALGKVGGDIVIGHAADEATIDSYVVYWGTDSTTKNSEIAVAEMSKTGRDLTVTLEPGTVPPANTTHLLVFTANSVGEMATGIATTLTDNVDTDAPIPGNSGALQIAVVSNTELDLSWSAATDGVTSGDALLYRVMRAGAADQFPDATDAVLHGEPLTDWMTDTTTISLTSLDENTEYRLGVLVKDAEGNTGVYSPVASYPADRTRPVPGNDGVVVVDTSDAQTVITLTWSAAVDVRAGSDVMYAVYEVPFAMDVPAEQSMDFGSLIGTWSASRSVAIPNTQDTSIHYYVVVAKDPSNNVIAYRNVALTMLDVTAPVPGGGNPMTLTFTNTTATSITVNWNAATDNNSSAVDYKVIYSTNSNDVNSVNIPTAPNGGSGPWLGNITSLNMRGLSGATEYYFNVIVRDMSLNMAVYSKAAKMTNAAIVYMFAYANITGNSSTGTTVTGSSISGRSGADALCKNTYDHIPYLFSPLGCDPSNVHAVISIASDDTIATMGTNYGLPTNVTVNHFNASGSLSTPAVGSMGQTWSSALANGFGNSINYYIGLAGGHVWTGATSAGGLSSNNCNGFSGAGNGAYYDSINPGDATAWLGDNSSFDACTTANKLLCVCW